MKMEEYLVELKGQIRNKHAKEFVTDELRGHIEDQAEAYEALGMSHEEALAKAVNEMGDPVGVGVELDRIHRPHMEWRFLLYVLFLSVLSIGAQYVIHRNMPMAGGAGIIEDLPKSSVFVTLIGVAVMLIVYGLDYTFLAGRSRLIGAAYLIIITALSVFRGQRIGGLTGWIRLGAFTVPVFALLVLFLPVFSGILYEYRGKGVSAVMRIALWMVVPVFVEVIAGYITFPIALFILIAEAVLFAIALMKDWYAVDKKAVILGGIGISAMLISIVFIRVYSFNGYQAERIKNWLAHYGIGNYAANADSTINYINNKLGEVFARSELIGKSDAAITLMKEIPSYRGDLVLGAVAASCGVLGMIGIILSLLILCVYVFRISLKQKNSLGSIVGCACGVAIGLQSLSNVLIVFGLLPLTDSVLPFFASGMSFTLVDYILLGLVLSIHRYKDIRKDGSSVHIHDICSINEP